MIMVKVGCPMIIIHLMAKRFLLKQYPASRGYVFACQLIPRKCSLCSQGTETTSLETNKIVWPFKWDLFGNYFFKWYYMVIENIVLKTLRLWTERYSNIWARLLIGICRPVGYGFWGSLSLNRLLLWPFFGIVFSVWSKDRVPLLYQLKFTCVNAQW